MVAEKPSSQAHGTHLRDGSAYIRPGVDDWLRCFDHATIHLIIA